MESMTYDSSTEVCDSKGPLIKDYNNITPSEIKNVLNILTQKGNNYASKQKKRKYKNVDYNPEFIEQPRLPDFPANTHHMIMGKSELHKRKYEHNKDCPKKHFRTTLSEDKAVYVPDNSHDSLCNLNEFHEENIPHLYSKTILPTNRQSPKCTASAKLPYEPVCVTLDSSDTEVISETLVPDCHSTRVKDTIVPSKEEESFSMEDKESIVLSDSEESEVEIIPADTCNITVISIDDDVQSVRTVEEDVQSIRTVKEDAESIRTVEEDAESISTVEDDFLLQKWRAGFKEGPVPCVVVSSDDEAVYDLQPLENNHFFSDNLKTSFECPVCLENIINCSHLSSTICGHVFCTNCITRTVTIYKTCPTCNCNLHPTQVHPVYLNFI